jgi:single-stranded-DNA-specific exonuclease
MADCASAVADVPDLEWIAAISLLSDSGERAAFAELTTAKRAHGLSALREATTLLNAARRCSSGNAQPALELLLRATWPREISRGDSPEALGLARGTPGGKSRLCRGQTRRAEV